MPTQSVYRPASVIDRVLTGLRPRLQHGIPMDSRSRSWARRVDSYDNLPDIYRGCFDSLPVKAGEHFPYAVLTPTFEGIRRKAEREKLVCIAGERLYVFEQLEHGLTSTCYPLEGRCFIERGVILLYSWITLNDPRSDGAVKSTTLRFNSVTDHLMVPFVERMRTITVGAESVDLSAERARFNYLAPTHYKFFSHGQASIRSGAQVHQILLQPEIRAESLRLFGYSLSKRVSPAHICILTDSELILITDDDSQFWLKGPPHGAIWSYIPRSLIQSASLSPKEKDLLTLSIDVSGNLHLQPSFEAHARSELEGLLQQMRM